MRINREEMGRWRGWTCVHREFVSGFGKDIGLRALKELLSRTF